MVLKVTPCTVCSFPVMTLLSLYEAIVADIKSQEKSTQEHSDYKEVVSNEWMDVAQSSADTRFNRFIDLNPLKKRRFSPLVRRYSGHFCQLLGA